MTGADAAARPQEAADPRLEWSFLGRRVLVVSRHVPARDGIARYTDQLLAVLGEGRQFTRLGIPGGGGDHVFVPWGWFRPLRLLRYGRGYDDVVVMYHPTTFHRGATLNRLASYASLSLVARLLPLTVVLHEADEGRPAVTGRRGRAYFRIVEWMRRRFWAGVPRVVLHTEWERRQLDERFPSRRRQEVLVRHEASFRSPVSASREQARQRLGLPEDRVALLSIGFLSPHKAVDGVIEAVERVRPEGLDLHIVGTPISDWHEVLEHVQELRALAARSRRVHLHEVFVDDEEFDLWIRAADAVVVAYRSAASSGVVARARLLGTPLITSGVGGLREQTGPDDVSFSTQEELMEAIRRLAPATAGPADAQGGPPAEVAGPAPVRAQGPDPRAEWDFLGDDVLHVSRHVPAEDGIANYADQLEQAVAGERSFTRLGIPFGGGDQIVVLWGGVRPLRLLRLARGYDDVLVHYIPWYFLRGGWLNRLASYLSLAVAARRLPASWIVHELDAPPPEDTGRRGRAMFAVEEALRRRFWGAARRVVVHSDWERQRLAERFPARRERDERVVSHGAFFQSAVSASRPEARRTLGLPADRTLLLCIGTLSPHKGVDRVIDVLSGLELPGVELHIVGRPIRRSPEVDRYAAELRELAARTHRVELHELYVSDEEFDLWIRAADAVVVAYRSAASSGVVERAHLLGTPLITSGAGGIAEQERPGDLHFDNDRELADAIRQADGEREPRG